MQTITACTARTPRPSRVRNTAYCLLHRIIIIIIITVIIVIIIIVSWSLQ